MSKNTTKKRTTCSYHDGRICHDCHPYLGHVLRDIICTDCGIEETITFKPGTGDLCWGCRIAANYKEVESLTREAVEELAKRAESKSKGIATLKDGRKWHIDEHGDPLPMGEVR